MDLTEIVWGDMNLIDLAQDKDQWKAFVNTVMKPSGSMKCWVVWYMLTVISGEHISFTFSAEK
jgi:hypothetical protein